MTVKKTVKVTVTLTGPMEDVATRNRLVFIMRTWYRE